jgi:hypothetical protein
MASGDATRRAQLRGQPPSVGSVAFPFQPVRATGIYDENSALTAPA